MTTQEHVPADILRPAPERVDLNVPYAEREAASWYAEHIRNGGKPDPVAEHLNAEMRAEVRAGQPWSFPAGSA